MERRKLAAIVAGLAGRISDFPDAAVSELFKSLGTIERKHGLVKPLSAAEKQAIDESLADADRFVTHEELKDKFASILKDCDIEAAGKEAFADAVSAVRGLAGEDQDEIANVIFALLDAK